MMMEAVAMRAITKKRMKRMTTNTLGKSERRIGIYLGISRSSRGRRIKRRLVGRSYGFDDHAWSGAMDLTQAYLEKIKQHYFDVRPHS